MSKNTPLLPFCIKLCHSLIFRSSKFQIYLEKSEKSNSPPRPNNFKTLKPRSTQGETCRSLYLLSWWCEEKTEKTSSWEHPSFGESANLEQLGKNQDHLRSESRLGSRIDSCGMHQSSWWWADHMLTNSGQKSVQPALEAHIHFISLEAFSSSDF